MIRAGLIPEIRQDSGDWLFVDIGFSSASSTCGILAANGEPSKLTFSRLRDHVVRVASSSRVPLNLLIEAPLSVAFNERGNPTGRSIERLGSQTRYWYVGLGCAVMVATTYLLQELSARNAGREIRLFEGFVSFKQKGVTSCHASDVMNLRDVVWHPERHPNAICAPESLRIESTDIVQSAFKVAGLDFGVPPVISAMANKRLHPTAAAPYRGDLRPLLGGRRG